MKGCLALDYIHINSFESIPLYQQVVNSIKSAIHNGDLIYGDSLPTELELCKAFSFSRIVATMAYDVLCKEHLIERIKGKGTFVSNRPQWAIPIERYIEIDTTASIQGQPIIRKTIQSTNKLQLPHISSTLDIDSNEVFYFVKRLFYVDRNQIMIQSCYVRQSFLKDDFAPLSNNISLLSWLESSTGLNLDHIESHVGVTNLESWEHLMLNVQPGSSAHLYRSKFIMTNNEVVCYMELKMPDIAIRLEFGQHD